ncbi:unnamed protein product [Clonostachys rosea f. rosea IK726]|uniref:Uncharacterized protein n=1 Tax=Clonostachys rosea f. rosea IK726 TaxID=1349383 RepID=A0ACA9UBP5_BIOOC|nr:unnamed protein product [Clonostachys rosea f. rosea IK726]
MEHSGPLSVCTARHQLTGEGDFVAISSKNAVIGAKAKEHDLTVLKGHRLRSHGGLSEQKVPLLMSHPSTWSDEAGTEKRTWRNFDIFDLC